MEPSKEKIDQLAWDNYWEKNPGKVLADNSRSDMVIGYVDGWNAAKENYDSLENMREAVKTMKEGVNIVKEVTAAYVNGWNANPAQYTEEDMWHMYNSIGRRDGHMKTSYTREGFLEMLKEYKNQQQHDNSNNR